MSVLIGLTVSLSLFDFGIWLDENLRQIRRNSVLIRLKICHKLLSLLVKSLNGILNSGDFAFLKIYLPALVTDPGRDSVEHQVIAVTINMEWGRCAFHLSMTMDAVHCGLLAMLYWLWSSSQKK